MTVDLTRLKEAVEWLDRMHDKTGMWPRQMTDPIVDGSRAVLSAPTARWCPVHRAEIREPTEKYWCAAGWAEARHMEDPQCIDGGTVALVPVDEEEPHE